LGLAFKANVWVLVPIYGWAKYSALSAVISRLAYREVIERPETVDEARRHVMPRMWSFLGAGFLVGLIVTAVMFLAIFAFSIVGGVLAAILGQNATAIIILVLLGIVAFFAFIIGYIRLVSRLFIVELPLAMEENVTATSTINRSLQLTKGFASRLQGIVFVAFLISLPISIVIQISSTILQLVLSALFSSDSPTFGLLYLLLLLALSLASGSLLIPFWQSIKAVIYYDLRSRREGLGLKLRDSR
jgi:MFS family permease